MAKDAAFKYSNISATSHSAQDEILECVWGSGLALPQHLFVQTEVEPHALCPTLLIGRRDGGELAVPCLTAFVPAGNLKETVQKLGFF